MFYILFVVLSGRNAFPRLPDFQYHEGHGLWIYQGRELDADEFNAACEVVFNRTYRNKDFTIRPLVVKRAVEAVLIEDAPAFTLVDGDILLDGERVGGVHAPGPHLRVARGRQDLRPALEAWFESQNFPES